MAESLYVNFPSQVVSDLEKMGYDYGLKVAKAIETEWFNNDHQSNKYLILGDMLELGKFSKKLHQKVSKIINKTSIKKVYVIVQ